MGERRASLAALEQQSKLTGAGEQPAAAPADGAVEENPAVGAGTEGANPVDSADGEGEESANPPDEADGEGVEPPSAAEGGLDN